MCCPRTVPLIQINLPFESFFSRSKMKEILFFMRMAVPFLFCEWEELETLPTQPLSLCFRCSVSDNYISWSSPPFVLVFFMLRCSFFLTWPQSWTSKFPSLGKTDSSVCWVAGTECGWIIQRTTAKDETQKPRPMSISKSKRENNTKKVEQQYLPNPNQSPSDRKRNPKQKSQDNLKEIPSP